MSLKITTLSKMIKASIINTSSLKLNGTFHFFKSCAKISVPPDEEFTLYISDIPIPKIIPPYIEAKSLSSVIIILLVNKFKKTEYRNVEIMVLTINSFPIFINPNIKSGTFNIKIVVPTDILKK